MQRKDRATLRIRVTILTGIAGIVLFGCILLMFQSRMTLLSLQEEMKENSSYICSAFTSNEMSGKAMQNWSDRLHKAYFLLMMYAMEQDPELLADQVSSEEFLNEMTSLTGAQDIMLVDRNGNIHVSSKDFFQDLKDETYAPLFQTFDTYEMAKLPIYSFSDENRQLRSAPFILKNRTGDQTGQTETEKTEEDNASQDIDSTWDESYYRVSNSFPILYSMMIDDQTACVINDYGVMQMMYEDQTDTWNYILKNEVIGSDGYAFVWSDKTGKILYYHPDNTAFKGKDVSTLGMDMEQIRDGEFVREKVNGQDMYLYPVYFSDQDAWVVCAVPARELTRGREITGIALWLLFGILAADLMYYAVLLLKQKKVTAGKGFLPFMKQRFKSSRKTKLLTFTVFCTVVIFLSSFYVQTLYLMSSWTKNSTQQIDKIEKDLKSQGLLLEVVRKSCADGSEKLAKLAGWFLEKYPEEATTQTLDMLESLLTLDNISVIDEDGNTILASSSYSPDAVNAAKEEEGAASTNNSIIHATTPLRGKNSIITGYLSVKNTLEALRVVQLTNDMSGTLKTVQPGEGGIAFAVDADSGEFIWHPDSNLTGKNALDYGLKKSDLQDNLCKYIQLNEETYYAVTGKYENGLIFLAIRDEKLFKQRLPVSVKAALAALAILLLTGLWLYTCPKEAGEAEPDEERPEKSVKTMPKTARSSSGREKTPEHKVFRILIIGVAFFAALLLLMRYFLRDAVGESILKYVLSGNWEHGLNVFALTASLFIVLECGLILFLLHRFRDLMTTMVSVRVETVIRMLVSLVSYVIVFYIVFRCLVNFGMEPSTLLASAGIVSVIIGIGANSLVGDIIAGLFLLVEGNIQVGDIIRIDGFRGVVEEIGIRMTKIYDISTEDVKIIPNKEIQNVLHLSVNPTGILMEFQICYKEDLERVEKLLREEFAKPEGRIPEMIGEPQYIGVRRLDDNGVVLLIKVKCKEVNRTLVTIAFNRKVYLLFRRNGIEVPFPQLTIHDGNDSRTKPEP